MVVQVRIGKGSVLHAGVRTWLTFAAWRHWWAPISALARQSCNVRTSLGNAYWWQKIPSCPTTHNAIEGFALAGVKVSAGCGQPLGVDQANGPPKEYGVPPVAEAHIAIGPETAMITAAAFTPGAGPEYHEATVALDLLADEPEGLQIFGDTAYSSDVTCGTLTKAGHELFLKPRTVEDRCDRQVQPGRLRHRHHRPYCHLSGRTSGRPVRAVDTPAVQGHLRRSVHRLPATSALHQGKTRRILTIRPNHDQQAAARHRATTDPDRQAAYRRWRLPVERVITWITGGGNRRLRDRGAIKNKAWLNTRAAALNLRTLIDPGLYRTSERWALAQA